MLKLDHLGEDVLNAKLLEYSNFLERSLMLICKRADPCGSDMSYMMGGIPTNVHGQALTQNSGGEDVEILACLP